MKIGAWCALVVLLTSSAAYPQSTTGTIWGQVTDIQGMAVPGAAISATSRNLQGTREMDTSQVATSFSQELIANLPKTSADDD